MEKTMESLAPFSFWISRKITGTENAKINLAEKKIP
jgi:hypothetical protein